MVHDFGFMASGSWFVHGSWFRVQGLGLSVHGSWYRVQGLGFRLQRMDPHTSLEIVEEGLGLGF